MRALITYDVSGKQEKVKAKMLAAGYSDHWVFKQRTYNLPNTTLWKQDVTEQRALEDLVSVVESIPGVQVLRAVATPCDTWWAVEGEPHADTE